MDNQEEIHVDIKLSDDDMVGWLVYRPDTDEFLHSHREAHGYSTSAYVRNPSYAYRFNSACLAFNFAKFMDKVVEVVPLYDLGDRFAVGFERNN